jgi:hypothetical protein
MWILIRYDLLNGHETIVDVVESYDDLCVYIDALVASVPTLRRINTDPRTMVHGQMSPILGNTHHDWYIKYMVPVNRPTLGV